MSSDIRRLRLAEDDDPGLVVSSIEHSSCATRECRLHLATREGRRGRVTDPPVPPVVLGLDRSAPLGGAGRRSKVFSNDRTGRVTDPHMPRLDRSASLGGAGRGSSSAFFKTGNSSKAVSHSAKVLGSRRTGDEGDATSNRADRGDDGVEQTASRALKSKCIPTPPSNGDAPELVEAGEIIVRGGGTHRELAAFSASIGDTPLFSPLVSPAGDERDAFAKANAAAAEASIFVGEALASSAARLLTARSPSRRPRHSAAQNPARASASSACQTSIAWDADGRARGVRS